MEVGWMVRTKRGEMPLHFAANNNNIQAIQILVDKAKQKGIEDFVNIKDFNGNTPLFSAYRYQAKEAISYLLELGADPFLKNKSKVSIIKSARRGVQYSSDFDRFVLGEIEKYSEDHCVQSLTE